MPAPPQFPDDIPMLVAWDTNPPLAIPNQPPAHIVDAFRFHIHNDIPARLIDTSTMMFVERDDVFDIFYPDITQISEVDVQRRVDAIRVTLGTDPELDDYNSLHKTVLQETIRDIVKYAIFSHRWGVHEPTYQEVSGPHSPGSPNKRRITNDAGFAKLVRLCETARALGYRFVWSDTCCIDKTNMVELSEAIYAMYKWYAHSHICIIHLAGSSSLDDFEHEPWFTRGWTLQELLAPRRIKFFDKAWQPFTNFANDKYDEALISALFTATGIPRDVIAADNSHGINDHDVWEILSWAATRQTTMVEDTAYCLFGILDVHPTIAYGEGENAFPRLVEAVAERYPTWDASAWSGVTSKRHSASQMSGLFQLLLQTMNIRTPNNCGALLETELPAGTSAPIFEFDQAPSSDECHLRSRTVPSPVTSVAEVPNPRASSELFKKVRSQFLAWFRMSALRRGSHGRPPHPTIPREHAQTSPPPPPAPLGKQLSTMSPAEKLKRTVYRAPRKPKEKKKKAASKTTAQTKSKVSSEPLKTALQLEGGPGHDPEAAKHEASGTNEHIEKQRRRAPAWRKVEIWVPSLCCCGTID